MESLRELLAPKTVNKISFAANICWFVLGVVLLSVFLDMELNEPRFHCDAKDDKELIQGKCYKQFEKRYNKLSIPVHTFVIWNFFIILIVCGIYSQYVKSRVGEHEEQQQPLEPRQEIPPRKLFKAYCFHLVARFLFGILCISLQKTVFYPQNFPSNLTCGTCKVNWSVFENELTVTGPSGWAPERGHVFFRHLVFAFPKLER